MLNEKQLEEINEIIGNLAPVKGIRIDEDTELRKHLGFDSLTMVEFLVTLEEKFEIELSENFLSPTTFNVLSDIYRVVEKHIEE